MIQPSFRFRQFEIFHDRCAMKVGTDGVLLGSWAQIEYSHRVLDIGTGSGLIAIMTAQRAQNAQIMGIDVDADSVCQAQENGIRSPFSKRLKFKCIDVREFQIDEEELFDCILCNPPYFQEDTLPMDNAREIARHTSALTFKDLLSAVERLITPEGKLHVVLPTKAYKEFITIAISHQFSLLRRCLVRTTVNKQAKRVLLTFNYGKSCETEEENITLQNPDGTRTEEYIKLTKDYYLW